MKLFFCLFLTTIIWGDIFAQQPLQSSFGKVPEQIGFLKNSGQVRDLKNKRVDFVYYQANIGEQQLFITKYGLSLLLSRPISTKKVAATYPGVTLPSTVSSSDSSCIVNYEMERIDIVLKGGSILPDNIVTKTNQQSPEFNLYFDRYETGGQGLRLQNEILVKNIYPGIDWKVYIKEENGKQASVKYDFVVHPGANPSLIKLRYSDNAKVELSGAGIKAVTRMGEVKEEKPYSYLEEDRSEVRVIYCIKKNTVSFSAGNYNKHNTLVIDPSIFWLTYLSTTNHMGQYLSILGNDVETDAAGNIFVQLSASANTPFPTVNPGGGAYYQDVTASPNAAMILAKFSPGGQMLWSTYFGNSVGGRTMTIDKFGNICTVGIVLDGIPNTNPSIPLLNNGGFYISTLKKYFISKFSNSGQLTWSSYYMNFSSYPIDMSYDINGNIYVVGWSEIYDFPVVDPGGGAYVVNNPQYGYAQVLFISQFNSNNQLTWSTRIEGNDYDPQARVSTDKLGNIYIVGDARSTNYPLLNAGGYFLNSGNSVITRFNPARQITWSTRFPSSFSMGDLTTDDDNNLYVVADKRILKFDAATQQVFQKSVPTTQMHFWKRICYDPVHDQIQLLGIMNDFYFGFPTINTVCNSSFFNDGISPHNYSSATGPIFATITRYGDFSYLSLVDWVAEYYQYFEITIDGNGDPVYIFGENKNGFSFPNPQLTNPGNGAYFDNFCAAAGSALLLKLTASESLLITTQVTPANGCSCDGSATASTQCGTAPYTYLWSNGATSATATGLCPGNYWVKVTDAHNLSKTINVSIPYPSGSVTSIIKSVIPENCNKANGRITIQSILGGTSPFTYSLDGITYQTAVQFVGLASGNYILRVKDASSCVYNDTILVSNIAGPSNTSFTIKKRSCIADDGQVAISNVQGGVGPYKYTLNGPVTSTNNTGFFNNLPVGTYQLQVADTAGCSITKTITVDKATAPSDVVYTTSSDHCNLNIGVIQPGNVVRDNCLSFFQCDSISFVAGLLKI